MAVNKRDLSTLVGETGFPVVNYAQEARNFQTTHNGNAGALSIPRFKFTYLVEFQFNARAFENPVTNLSEFTKNGKLYTHLLTMDHPSPTFKTEKLRSYNKWINVPVQVEFPQASMTFHDDSTSITMALWKEHLNFYTHLAQVGDTISGEGVNSNLGSSKESNSFQFTDELVGPDMRSNMGQRPSLGMKLKPNDMRHFFESIVIYDLGTEPDGINVYWFHRPMITGWAHDNLDLEDRTGNVRVSATFDYESMYFTIGQNRGRLGDYIQTILGAAPENIGSAPRKDGIARDGRQSPLNQPVNAGNSNAFELPTNEGLDFFPGEDALIRQGALAGSGLMGDNTSVAANALAEQLASPAGLNSPGQTLKNSLEAAGTDLVGQSLNEAVAETYPLGTRAGQDLIPGPLVVREPLSTSELNPKIPPTDSGKIRAMEQNNKQALALLDEIGDRPVTSDERRRLEAHRARGEELINAAQRSRKFAAKGTTVSPATSSALANTKAKFT